MNGGRWMLGVFFVTLHQKILLMMKQANPNVMNQVCRANFNLPLVDQGKQLKGIVWHFENKHITDLPNFLCTTYRYQKKICFGLKSAIKCMLIWQTSLIENSPVVNIHEFDTTEFCTFLFTKLFRFNSNHFMPDARRN